MICLTSIPAAWSSAATAGPRSPRPARAARSARSALRSRASIPSRRGCASQTRRLVRNFAAVSLSLSALAVVLYGLWRGGWLDALLSGIALGMSMLPEEFPLVLTVFMVMGAWRISRARVLTRRVAAIETLGAATVLCTDKTGTLTQNRMTIVALRAGDDVWRQERRRPARRHVRSAPRVRHSRQRARAVRSDGEGVPCPRRRTLAADRRRTAAAR